ncbi:hypothetical protein GQX74_005418 [Glossina fuscipes]|nr:hypothetical protein GQX74_005418 [Glossina fuscipes]
MYRQLFPLCNEIPIKIILDHEFIVTSGRVVTSTTTTLCAVSLLERMHNKSLSWFYHIFCAGYAFPFPLCLFRNMFMLFRVSTIVQIKHKNVIISIIGRLLPFNVV